MLFAALIFTAFVPLSKRVKSGLAVASALALVSAANAADYTFITINVPDAAQVYATGKNRGGQIIVQACNRFVCYSFLYTSGVFIRRQMPGNFETIANGINDGERIVGFFQTSSLASRQGFQYSDGASTTINVPGSSSTEALA
jgi:hypothetical protein